MILLWLAGAALIDHLGEAEVPAAHADVLVVPGCAVVDGGPSRCLADRVDAAVALWKAGRAPRLVVTGGAFDGEPSQGEVAAARAVAAGVPRGAVVVEDRSHSTETNALWSLPLVDARSWIVVTDGYHVPRARRCFALEGAETSGQPVTPPPWPRFTGAMREVLATVYYAATGRCQNRPPSDPP